MGVLPLLLTVNVTLSKSPAATLVRSYCTFTRSMRCADGTTGTHFTLSKKIARPSLKGSPVISVSVTEPTFPATKVKTPRDAHSSPVFWLMVTS